MLRVVLETPERTKQRIALFFVSGLLALTGMASGAYEDGRAAYDRQDDAAALKLLLPLAEQGDARAQADVGPVTVHLIAERRRTDEHSP